MLRRLEQRDLAQTFRFRNDPEVYKWCRQNAPLHWANHTAWFDKQAKDPAISMFVITRPKAATYENDWLDDIIGVCGLTDIDMVNRRAEFSLYIGKEYQGQGYGLNSLIELFKYGFYDLGLNVIWGESFEGNPALILFKRLNMTEEGLRRDFYFRNGRFINAHLISISRESFDSYLNTKKEIDTPRNPADHPLTPT